MSFKNQIITLIKEESELSESEVAQLLSVPPDSKLGDFAFPCFKVGAALKVSPKDAADKLKLQLEEKGLPDYLEKVEAHGPYLNFFVDSSALAKKVLSEISEKKSNYGSQDIGKGETIIVEYSSPNIAKPFGIGHLRSTIIGNSLNLIYKKLGYNTVSINHLGDWGTQFGKMIVAYKLWGDKTELEKDPISYLLSLYVKFHAEAEKDESLVDQGRAAFKSLETGDKESRELWEKFKNLSLKEFQRIYEILGISFDSLNGEAFYEDKMEDAIKRVQENVETKISEGALIVDLEEYNMPPLMLRKSDGSTIYHTRDITAAYYRLDTYSPLKILYVVGSPQKLHFQQLFKTMELAGFSKDKFEHVDFGLIRFADKKMSTRKGNIILLDEVLNKSIEKVRSIIEEKNPNLTEKEEVAKQVGIGAVIFADLHTDRIKDVNFDWDKILSFEGESGPYLQYTHARACSILRKSNTNISSIKADYSLLDSDSAKQILVQLSSFPEIIVSVTKHNKPHTLANYLITVAQKFNEFYVNNKVICDDKELMQARLLVVDSVRQVLENGLGLLGISAPEEM